MLRDLTNNVDHIQEQKSNLSRDMEMEESKENSRNQKHCNK